MASESGPSICKCNGLRMGFTKTFICFAKKAFQGLKKALQGWSGWGIKFFLGPFF